MADSGAGAGNSRGGWFTNWNDDRNPPRWGVGLFLCLSVLWALTWFLVDPDSTARSWRESWLRGRGTAILLGYVWAGVGGLVCVGFLVESCRWLWSRDCMRPFEFPDHPQLSNKLRVTFRQSPRIEPIILGVIERVLFTTLALILPGTVNNNITLLGTAAVVYVGLKSIKRMQPTTVQVHATHYAIWGSAANMAFAIFGARLFELALDP